jgi:tRNA U55 pseudouridine synthase TruB
MHSAKKVGGKVLYELARQGIEIEREARSHRVYSFEILSFERGQPGSGHPVARAAFRVRVSSGTYVRTLAQDLGRAMGTVAMLDSLHRTESGIHRLSDAAPSSSRDELGDGASASPTRHVTSALGSSIGHYRHAMTLGEIEAASQAGRRWDELPAWVPFDRLLDGYEGCAATPEEALALIQGKQAVLPRILARIQPPRVGASSRTPAGADAQGAPVAQNAPVAIYQGDALVAIARLDHGVWGLERVFVPDEGECGHDPKGDQADLTRAPIGS